MTDIERFEAKLLKQPNGQCWLWQGYLKRGYGQFRLGDKMVKASRFAYQIYKGDPGDNHVLHNCDNKRCCNPDHLRLGDHQDNMDDYVLRHEFKLSHDQINDIRQSYKNGATQQSIADRFGISRSHVGNIVNKRTRVLTQ